MNTIAFDHPQRCFKCCENDWPRAHVHCSGCGYRIVLEGEGGNELPKGTNACTMGHPKHGDCACSDYTMRAMGMTYDDDCRGYVS